jgi:RHS repeat-associated protein
VGPSGWVALAPEDFVVGPAPDAGGISAGGGGPPQRLRVLVKSGWTRGASYRVRLAASLTDGLSRRFGRTEELEWHIPEAEAGNPNPAVAFDKRIPLSYETWDAATNNINDRFPGGQTQLFQGLWTDPVTGVAYARARWYDARNAVWLSEDPMGPVDSENLYAFVGLQPNSRFDPLGLWSWESFGKGAAKAAIGIVVATVVVAAVAATGGAAAVVLVGALGASAATAATVGTVVTAGVYVAASAYGGFQVGTNIYEATTGKQYDLNGQGRQLTDDERSEAAGEAVTGVLALGIMAGRARSTEVQDQQLIDNLVETRAGRIEAGTETGNATLAQGRSITGTVTSVAESVATPEGTGPHAEPQAMPIGGTTAVDQVPCTDCASRALLRGTRVIVPEDPAKPGQSPKSAARAAAKGKITVQPRTVLPGAQGPIPFTGGNHRKNDEIPPADRPQEH